MCGDVCDGPATHTAESRTNTNQLPLCSLHARSYEADARFVVKRLENSTDKMPSSEAASTPSGGSADKAVLIENATCHGCGKQADWLQVFYSVPAGNVCLCRGCLESEPNA